MINSGVFAVVNRAICGAHDWAVYDAAVELVNGAVFAVVFGAVHDAVRGPAVRLVRSLTDMALVMVSEEDTIGR